MKAIINNSQVDAWQITTTGDTPDWVMTAFNRKLIWWNTPEKDVLVIATPRLGVSMGTTGWYLIKSPENTYRVISEKSFHTDYQLISK
ncbi:hypothetical protein B9D04_06260 [Weissella cibaria]|uniref:Uncharacterized protein n=1 Tax=Weissella cibaria TaxID=137591 RepID=A0A1X4JL70_9LACO|nr:MULTISPECIES: hypothetical protein [Weissella]APS26375.1 hypothetical protein AUC63_00300 [Weissella cibaria]APU63878.1 hypothetical protein AUC65_02128 [Weissella cibaria]APU66028.1 hypothetical protein AUC62_02120 [Weissella cibaria]ASS52696.1 hypothetical protein CHR48_01791 [Weissella cibaria]KXU09053.1 hypothetical protein WEIDD23_00781 [Weissella sp. DD23]